MAAILITYDLNKPGKDYSGLYDTIKMYSWARLSESSYAIITDKHIDTIYNELKEHIDSNDVLYVVSLKKPWNGYGPKEVNEWLRDNLSTVYQY